MGVEKRVFVRKSSGANLYKWSPSPNNVNKNNAIGNAKAPYFCSAIPNSQGEDWFTTYTYNLAVINGVAHRIAYVQCDYVS
ncbi:MAG: hypothetical protein E6R13_05860 [Spirochaetes bacterium]|nr:MAG: hypothetical protein E6R13_05860 [Spirochaetota bacterium]